MLNTHMDTVPPYIPPSCDGIRVQGRGANDAKGNTEVETSILFQDE